MSFTLRTKNYTTHCKTSNMPKSRTYVDKGKQSHGNITEDEARRQQSLQYAEDKKKFIEKEKEKANKKKLEKWSHYNHVKIGCKLNSGSESETIDIQAANESNYAAYQDAARLEQEKQKKINENKIEQRKKRKFEKYAHVRIGQKLGSSEDPVSNLQSSQDVSNIPSTSGMIGKKLNSIKLSNENNGENTEMKILENASCNTIDNDSNMSKLTNTEKEKNYREQMKKAREQMQRKYDEMNNK